MIKGAWYDISGGRSVAERKRGGGGGGGGGVRCLLNTFDYTLSESES